MYSLGMLGLLVNQIGVAQGREGRAVQLETKQICAHKTTPPPPPPSADAFRPPPPDPQISAGATMNPEP